MLAAYLPAVTTDALARLNICTLQDLQDFKGKTPVPTMPVTLSCIKWHVWNQTAFPFCSTLDHSWAGKVCHIQNSRGGMVRCTIRQLFINSHSVLLEVLYTGKSSKKRTVDPFEILMNHFLWCSMEFVSDDDSDGSIHNRSEYDAAPSLLGRWCITATDDVLGIGGVRGLYLKRLITRVNCMYQRIEASLHRNIL